MRLSYDKTTASPCGYTLWLSEGDTEQWATRPSASWPCSTLRGRRLAVSVDSNGLCDLTIDGRHDTDCDPNELAAVVADHLPKPMRHLWPTWEFTQTATEVSA